MSSRKNGSDSASQNGVSFAAGNPALSNSKNVNYSQFSNNKLATATAYNGHAVEVWSDGAVYDTVSGAFLFPFRDYDPNTFVRA